MLQHDFILIDASGSMGMGSPPIWPEMINATNTYVQKLADENVDTGVTIAIFDSIIGFKIIRDRITPKTFKPITNEDARPGGGTPLNDATMDLLDLAEKGAPWGAKYDRVAIAIATDGGENASSRHTNTDTVKERLNGIRARGWQVTYFGANYDNVAQGMSYGGTRGSTISSSYHNLGSTMSAMASKRAVYGVTGQSISWSEDEQAAAKSETKVGDET